MVLVSEWILARANSLDRQIREQMRAVWDNLDNGDDDDDDDDDDYLQRCGNGVCSWRGCKVVEMALEIFRLPSCGWRKALAQ